MVFCSSTILYFLVLLNLNRGFWRVLYFRASFIKSAGPDPGQGLAGPGERHPSVKGFFHWSAALCQPASDWRRRERVTRHPPIRAGGWADKKHGPGPGGIVRTELI